jgi:hypothetical protein
MGFEFFDRRKEKAAAEAAAPMEPEVFAAGLGGALEAAVAGGDVKEINRVSSECGGGPEHKVVEFKKQVHGEKLSWKSVGYVMVIMPMGPPGPGQNQLFMIRAVGLRTDEMIFTADYALPPIWEEGADYAGEAKYRLDTFKSCACDTRGRCKFHGEVCIGPAGPGRWIEEDIKRIKKIQTEPVPEAVEVLMRAEAERAQRRIVVPGRVQ